jgi:hypothetical protein
MGHNEPLICISIALYHEQGLVLGISASVSMMAAASCFLVSNWLPSKFMK